MTWLLKGGRVIDPVAGVDELLDVLLEDGVVKAIGRDLPAASRQLDCRDRYVVPGLIDLGARIGEPGFEHRETIATVTKAAAAGGFSAVCALPETDPILDTPQAVRFVVDQAAKQGVVRVYPSAELTKGALGQELTETGALIEAGAVAMAALHSIADSGMLRRALQYAGMFQTAVLLRGVDDDLAGGGVMHEGLASTIWGLKGMPSAAEEAAAARNLIVAQLTGVPVHLLAVSSAGTVELIRGAKQRGVPVTASVSAQQLIFTDEDVQADDARWKVDPPFRGTSDREALRAGVEDGTIDVIFSDHAPWSQEEKDVEFDLAPFGMSGVETALALVLSELVRPGLLTRERMVQCMSSSPARILGVAGGSLLSGVPADVTVIDPDASWVFEAAGSASQSRTTPVDGRALIGKAVATFVGGELIMKNGRIVKG